MSEDLAHYELLPNFAAIVRSERARRIAEPDPVAVDGDLPPAPPLYLVATIPPVDPKTRERWRLYFPPQS